MQLELKAYESKVNLDLLNDIVAFVLDTAERKRQQRAENHWPQWKLDISAGGRIFL